MNRSDLAKLAAAVVLFCSVLPAWPDRTDEDLTQRSLVDLMNIEVTSVSKKEQKLSQTASAVFVISQDDIRRSGAINIPDLLRMAPGVDVAQINSSTWAISVRGFNGQYSNKLLVLLDGRTVYSPMWSGVFWNAQDVPLETIDRIEVIRGPGATVWGANAVNGVINILTKKAKDTQGGLLSVGAGSYENGIGTARYGGTLNPKVAYRIFADAFTRNHLPAMRGGSGHDDWNLIHGGFRADVEASLRDSVTIQGDAHSGRGGEVAGSILQSVSGTLPLNERFSGWNFLSRWDHVGSTRSATSLQWYFDRITRGDPIDRFGLNTFDIDFQHHVALGERQDLVWGIDYRVSSDRVLSSARIFANTRSSLTTQLFSSFVQDEFSLVPDRVYLSLGAKLEHNRYTGFGLLPSARISWTPSARSMFWAAVSQAERTPARSDTDMRLNDAYLPQIPLPVRVLGNLAFKNEVLGAVESGYRCQAANRVSLDGTIFFNKYHHLASLEPSPPLLESSALSSHYIIPVTYRNLEYGETHGLEVFANWRVLNRWTISPGYSFLSLHIHNNALSQDVTSITRTEGGSPHHQAQLRSHVDLPGHWGWNTSAFFVGRLLAQNVASYTRLDTNLTRHVTETLSITLAGENLLKDRHLESNNDIYSTVSPSLPKRSAYAKITWQF